MWACTVTGAPKPAALQEIENLESSPRRWFSGAVGLLMFNGNINTGITLRTANIRNGRASIRAGATLLHGSDPVEEEKETRTKAEALVSVIAQVKNPKAKATTTEDLPRVSKKILLVDCRDSFVHNLGAYIRELGCEVITVRPSFLEETVKKVNPDLVFFSPGPGTPEDFGLASVVNKLVEAGMPLFGVCLGHQGLASAFGAKINTLELPKHGKPSLVTHNNDAMFAGIKTEFEVGRYHSLYVDEASLHTDFEVTARTTASEEEPSIIMALRHKTLPIASVQFHPESLMTLKNRVGHKILANSLSLLTCQKS